MKCAAAIAAMLLACSAVSDAQALLGGTPTLTSKPRVTGEEVLKLSPQRRNEVLAKTVREGSFVSRGVCAPGEARVIGRRPSGAPVWRMDCADAEPQVVVMPQRTGDPATVLSCRKSAALLGVDCGTRPSRRAAR